jgi:hypothetical protein
VKNLKPPIRWLRSHWQDEDILFYFEFDEDGWAGLRIERVSRTRPESGS